MSARLAARVLIDALGRRVRDAGGHLTILAKGDETAGTMMFLLCERGQLQRIVEPARNFEGGFTLIDSGPQDIDNKQEVTDYLERRRTRDPDLWLIELDIVQAERFAAETLGVG